MQEIFHEMGKQSKCVFSFCFQMCLRQLNSLSSLINEMKQETPSSSNGEKEDDVFCHKIEAKDVSSK